MDFKLDQVNACTYKLSVNVATSEVNAAYDQALRKVSKGVTVPGFRPGKVPRGLIERQYAAAVQEECRSALVDSTLAQAVQEAKLEPVTMPRLQLDTVVRDTPLTYTAFVEVRPTITLGTYKGLAVPPAVESLGADAVDEALQALRKEVAQVQPVTDRDTVGPDDLVQIDFEGFVEGEAFAGGKGDNTLLDVADSGFIPGFAEGLVGAKVPGTTEVAVTFPDDYSAEQLAGKPATFKVTLHELKARRLPDLDDEFAKDQGKESLAELTESIRADLLSRKKEESQSQRRQAVVQALVDANPIDVPPSMVDSQTDSVVQATAARFERMVGKKFQLSQEQWQALRQNSVKEADFQVRSGLLLLEVAKQSDLTVDDAQLDAEIEQMAAANPQHAEQVRVAYADPERRSQLHYAMLEERTVSYLLEHSIDAEPSATPEQSPVPA